MKTREKRSLKPRPLDFRCGLAPELEPSRLYIKLGQYFYHSGITVEVAFLTGGGREVEKGF